MKDQPEIEVSWRDISAHCPVFAADGARVGRVVEVAALPNEDIFHGIVFTHHLLGQHRLAPASDIARITERAIYLKTTSPATEQYGPFEEMHIERLGVSGLFRWKHLGWRRSSE